MKYIDFKKPGSSDVLFLNQGTTPKPKESEVLIQVKAAGVNRPDISQREGKYPLPPGINPIIGLEISGIISKLGVDVKKWKIGDKVCALTNGGGYAEYCCVPEGQCLPIPHGLNFEEAASLPETYFTVWGNLFMRTQLNRGESILIHGGSSGIGSCAIQLAKAFGAQVITTVSNRQKIEFCKNLRADRVINYKEEDFSLLLKDQGVDVILDIIGGEYFEKNLALLRDEGRLVQISCMKGSHSTIDLNRLLFKRLTVVGSTLRAQSPESKARIAQGLLAYVWPLFENNTIRPVVTAVFPLAKAGEAHRLMESGQLCGKIVLIME